MIRIYSGTKNSEISYRILHSDYSIESFSIDSVTGVLKPIRPVDFEKLQNRKHANNVIGNLRPINLVVQAQDRGLPSLSDETHVIVYVEDVNDFGPKFESGSYETTISEDLIGGSTVLQVIFVISRTVQTNSIIAATNHWTIFPNRHAC